VRYHGAQKGVSPWSATDSFTTGSNGSLDEYSKFYAKVPTADECFGVSVALSSDGNTAIIGAHQNSEIARYAGIAYIYTRTGNVWTQQQKIHPSDNGAERGFGIAVALNADATIALVGSHQTPSGGYASSGGTAYLFQKINGTWTQIQKIPPHQFLNGAQFFSVSVAMTPDASFCLIGAMLDSVNGIASGSVNYYKMVNGLLVFVQTFIPNSQIANVYFGRACAISADGTIALIGESSNSDKGSTAGAVYIFIRSGDVWTQQQKFYESDAAAGDGFGSSVSLSADATIALIGAVCDSTTGNGSSSGPGSVVVFTRVGAVWTQQRKIFASDALGGVQFGSSVSITSDGTIALIGNVLSQDYGAASGAVYFYK